MRELLFARRAHRWSWRPRERRTLVEPVGYVCSRTRSDRNRSGEKLDGTTVIRDSRWDPRTSAGTHTVTVTLGPEVRSWGNASAGLGSQSVLSVLGTCGVGAGANIGGTLGSSFGSDSWFMGPSAGVGVGGRCSVGGSWTW